MDAERWENLRRALRTAKGVGIGGAATGEETKRVLDLRSIQWQVAWEDDRVMCRGDERGRV